MDTRLPKSKVAVADSTLRIGVPLLIVKLVLAMSVVKVPAAGVVPPIAPGAANVAPFNDDAFRFGTFVVEPTVNGGVPVATVDVKVEADVVQELVWVVDVASTEIVQAPLVEPSMRI